MRHKEITKRDDEVTFTPPNTSTCVHGTYSLGLRPHPPKREYATHALHDDAVLVFRARCITTIAAELVALDNGIMRNWPSRVPT